MSQKEIVKKIKEAAAYIGERIRAVPDIAIVLGTGLGDFASNIENPVFIPYAEIPHFPVSTVEGHVGRLVIGELSGKTVLAMQGRFHYYEGYSLEQATFGVRVIRELGCINLLLTNAAGGVNKDFSAGDLVLVDDHINLSGISPLRGANLDEYGTRFPDMADVYSREFNERVAEAAGALGVQLRRGVYVFMPGPQFETAAEIRMARVIGGDVVGMSTVPEAIVAAHMKMRTTCISCVTNMGTGVLDAPIDHAGINMVAKRAEANFTKIVKKIVEM